MRRPKLTRPSPALVVSFIALMVSLGGSAYAGFNLPHASVGSKQLKNGAVTSAKLANGAVTTSKLKKGAVTAAQLNTAGVTVPNALQAVSAMSATTATSAANATDSMNATNATNATNLVGAGWGLVDSMASPTLTDGHNATVTHPGSGRWCIDVPGASSSTAAISLTSEFDNSATLFDQTNGAVGGVEWDETNILASCPAGQYAVLTYSIQKGTGSGLQVALTDESFSFFVP